MPINPVRTGSQDAAHDGRKIGLMTGEFRGVQERDGSGDGGLPDDEVGVLKERGHGLERRWTDGSDRHEFRALLRREASAEPRRFSIVTDFVGY